MRAQNAPAVRAIAGGLTAVDLAMVALLARRSRLMTPFVGPPDDDLYAWSTGVIATYTVAQAAIAIRPTRGGARLLASLRAVLIGGDLMMAARGRRVFRPWGLMAAAGNLALALAAMYVGGGRARGLDPARAS
jgi:hypothetical protein